MVIISGQNRIRTHPHPYVLVNCAGASALHVTDNTVFVDRWTDTRSNSSTSLIFHFLRFNLLLQTHLSEEGVFI